LRIPFPPYDGATIAMFNLAESLSAAGATVTMLSFNTKKHFIDLSKIDETFSTKYKLKTVYVDASVKPFEAFLNLFKKNESYNIARFETLEFHQALRQLLSENTYDVIQLEGMFLSPYLETIRSYSKAKIVLRAHNVEWLIWQRMGNASTNFFRKKYLLFLAQRLRRYEQHKFNAFDAVLALTKEDQELLIKEGCKVPVFIAPVGVNTVTFDNAKEIKSANKLTAFHLGSMDWLPNSEGVNWFLAQVWPMVIQKTDAIILHLAGKKMAESYFKLKVKNLKVEGEIRDAKKFMSDKEIMIVPLLSGGGMRVKIIEGLAAGKVIISTAIGAEGIEAAHGKNILIANTPEEFADVLLSLIDQTDRLNLIAKEAQTLARHKYDMDVIGKMVYSFYSTIISGNGNR
jgi:glycosyltransferase involved in cell wall biosynthesis